MMTFLITLLLFTAGAGYISSNARIINRVKDEMDYKAILTNFHQLSYSKITEMASRTDTFDFYDGTAPSESFSVFIDDFKGYLDDSLFLDQWEIVKDDFDENSDHTLLLSYSTKQTNEDNLYINAFSDYIDCLPEKDHVKNCESVMVKIDDSDRKALVINKLELNSGSKQFSAAVFQKSHFNKYLYFTEVEPSNIWFTDGDVFDGPLASLGAMGIAGNPIFNGTVYYNPKVGDDGFRYYDSDSEGDFNGGKKKINLTMTFQELAQNHKEMLNQNSLSFSSFFPKENPLIRSNLQGNSGSQIYFKIEVPETATNLEVKISGGSGDADLYLKRGEKPTTSSYDHRPYLYGNDETITIENPIAGVYHIMIRGFSGYSGVTLNAFYEPDDDALFDFDTYASYTSTVPSSEQLKFGSSHALVLDVESTDYDVDLDDKKITIDWKGENNELVIEYTEAVGSNNIYEATYTYNNGSDTKTISGVPFSGYISAVNNDISIGDHDKSSTNQDICFYDGKLTFQTEGEINIKDHLMPTELKDLSDLNYGNSWDATKNNQIKNLYNNNYVDSSLNLVADGDIYIGPDSEDNHKIFGSLYSFDGKIQVDDYDSISPKGQLTLFGSMMQHERGAVGQFTTTAVKNILFTDDNYYTYKVNSGVLKGRYPYQYNNWHEVYTFPSMEETIDWRIWNGGWGDYGYAEVYYYTYQTTTTSGYNKNYLFDPRFLKGYPPAIGAPQDGEALDVILSSVIEAY